MASQLRAVHAKQQPARIATTLFHRIGHFLSNSAQPAHFCSVGQKKCNKPHRAKISVQMKVQEEYLRCGRTRGVRFCVMGLHRILGRGAGAWHAHRKPRCSPKFRTTDSIGWLSRTSKVLPTRPICRKPSASQQLAEVSTVTSAKSFPYL